MSKGGGLMAGATLFAMLALATVAGAAPIKVTVNTAAFAGTSATLAFDLIDGGPPSNSVSITAFTTDGTLGSSQASGDVTGSLPGPVTLGDGSFFSEYLQSITLGTSFSFIFDTTGNAAEPGSLPDAFSLFVLDAVTGTSLLATSDPTGADALLLYGIGEASALAVYTADGLAVTTEVVRGVPAPGTFLLALTACCLLLLRSPTKRAVGFRARIALVEARGELRPQRLVLMHEVDVGARAARCAAMRSTQARRSASS